MLDNPVSRQSQEKVRKFREDLHQHGFGPNASTGDADFFALGIGATTDSYEDDATPRRRCLLESLSLEVRHAVTFSGIGVPGRGS